MFNPIRRYTRWLHTRWPAGVVEKLPESGKGGLTNIPGVRIVGDLTGIPLLKFSSKTGAEAVHDILAEPDFRSGDGERTRNEDGLLDLAIIGGGVSGVSAAIEARKAGLNFKIFEATQAVLDGSEFSEGQADLHLPERVKAERRSAFHEGREGVPARGNGGTATCGWDRVYTDPHRAIGSVWAGNFAPSRR